MFEATPARHERPRSPSQVVHRPSIDAVELGIELPLGFAPPVHVSVAAAIEDIRARLDSVLRFDDFECRRRKRQFAWIAFSLASVAIVQVLSAETSSHFMLAILSRRCAVSSASRTKAPYCPLASAAFHTARISSSDKTRSRFTGEPRRIPFTKGER